MKNKLKITQYTDPICIWCYALEPTLRKIEFLLPVQVEFHSVLGLLVADSKDIIGDNEFSEMRFAQLKAQMREHFKEAADRGGIPMSLKHMDAVRPEDITSLPASRAVASMKLLDERAANRYLRRIREAFHSDDLNTNDETVLRALAGEFPVDQQKFWANLSSGAAQQALESDIAVCHLAGVRAFPTTKLEYGDKRKMVQGYMEYTALKNIIVDLTDGEILLEERAATPEAMTEYVTHFGRVTARELQTAFSLDEKSLESSVKPLVDSGMFRIQPCGDSYFVQVLSKGSCDPVTGVCSL